MSKRPMTIDKAIELAELWAGRGYPVFPVAISLDEKKGGTRKRPLTAHGHRDATVNPEQIRRRFNGATLRRGEEIGVGLYPGGNHRFVVDVDVRPDVDGHDTLAALEGEHGRLPDHPIVPTPSGGSHHYFRRPTNLRVGNAHGVGDGIDIRGDDGWVVSPGTHTSWGEWTLDGATYVPAPMAPAWLLERLGASNGSTSSGGRWQVLDRGKLHPADLAALEALEVLGGHDPYIGGDGAVEVVRPGKRAGGSASIGHIAPGVAKMFSSDWEIPGTGVRFPIDGRFVVDTLEQIVDSLGDKAGVSRLVNGAKFAPETKERTPSGPVSIAPLPGGDWLLDAPEGIPAVWGGRDGDVLWAEGEGLIIAGPPGVGKTTLAAQLVFARLGLIPSLLGYPVEEGKRALYLAMDRPRQVQRTFQRLVRPDHRDILNDRLRFLPGPPPLDLAKYPEILACMASKAGADTVFLDSLKDAALGLSDDEVGAGLNRAVQQTLAAGIEVCGLHHQRKGQGGVKPKTLEDLYGSVWIVAGAGSVLLLWGQPGDELVELTHLKQPGAPVGPFYIEHDHDDGTTVVERSFDPLYLLRDRPNGLTAVEAGKARYAKTPSDNETRIMRRVLDKLVAKGFARKIEAVEGGPTGTQPARWYAVNTRRSDATGPPDTPTGHPAHQGNHRTTTGHHRTGREKAQVNPPDTPTDTTGHPGHRTAPPSLNRGGASYPPNSEVDYGDCSTAVIERLFPPDFDSRKDLQ